RLGPGRTLPPVVLDLALGARLPVLLALAPPRIAREQAGLLERQAELLVAARQRARQSVTHRAGLPRRASAADRHKDVELPDRARHLEGLRDDHAQGLAREVILERPPVHDDPTGARPDPHSPDRPLPTACRPKPV